MGVEALAWTCVGLIGLNVYQLWFWAKQTDRLVDKIMSKNYAEFVQVEQARANIGQTASKTGNSAEESADDDAVLRELNGMFSL